MDDVFLRDDVRHGAIFTLLAFTGPLSCFARLCCCVADSLLRPSHNFFKLHSYDELVSLIGGLALDRQSSISFDDPNASANLRSILDILPALSRGLDVNPKFCHGVRGYEYTGNMAVFDLFGVELVHGWLLDPSDPQFDLFKDLSYNQLVELVISADTSSTTPTGVKSTTDVLKGEVSDSESRIEVPRRRVPNRIQRLVLS